MISSYFPLIAGIGAVIAGIIVHIVWWRLSHPRDDIRALAITCLAVPFAVSVLVCVVCGLPLSLHGILDGYLPTVFLALVLGALYINLYPAAQAASPTMLILLLLDRRKDGMSINDLLSYLDDSVVQAGSIQHLVDEKFAIEEGSLLKLAPRGSKLLRCGRLLRKIAGVKKGGG